MPYRALYRERRPRVFGEIIGQPHIVRALGNQLRAGQVSHAYLFCGTRGTGKTSAAKILARAVNCLSTQAGEPCNVCDMCQSILAERCLDVAEIDAASNNGVENIRDLREEVKFLPTQGRYKVYIVDEAHMLSTSAFNALLKTLEEPPAHVIFILATTDPQKVPATILSRCQRYDFRRISAADTVAALKGYLLEENRDFEEAALDYIAYHSDGAMRDALSLLDQCLSLADNGLSLADVRDILGAADRAALFAVTDALAENNSRAVIEIITKAVDDGRDVSQFAADLVRHFRDVLVTGLIGGEATADTEYIAQSHRVPAKRLMEYINAFSELLREMRFAPHIRTAFEVCALRLCMRSEIETSGTITQTSTTPQPKAAKPSKSEPRESPLPSTLCPLPSAISDISEIAASWGKLCKRLPNPLRSWCAHCGLTVEDGVLKLISDNETTMALVKGKQSIIRDIIAEHFKLSTPPNLAFEVIEAYNGTVKTEELQPVNEPEPDVPDDWASFGQAVIDDEGW